jgi:hypothetical protein
MVEMYGLVDAEVGIQREERMPCYGNVDKLRGAYMKNLWLGPGREWLIVRMGSAAVRYCKVLEYGRKVLAAVAAEIYILIQSKEVTTARQYKLGTWVPGLGEV